jgi:PAS domain S-box-containing protein
LEVLLGQLQDAVAFVDRTGTVLLTNRADELMVRSPSASTIARGDSFQIFHPDGRAYELAEWPVLRSMDTGERVVEEECFRLAPDGSRRIFSCSSDPIRGAGSEIVAAVIVARDITERTRSDEQLAQHTSLLDNVDDAVVGTDAEFRLTVWNGGAERLYGYTAQEVLGRDAREVASYPGDHSRLDLEAELLKTGRTRTDITAYRKDRTQVDVELISVAIRGDDGEITGYLGIHRDVTELNLARTKLETTARQQALLADLSLRALAGDRLQELLNTAGTVVAEVLDVELTSIVELAPGGTELIWRAAFGYPKGLIASAPSIRAGTHSLAGYALMVGEPVISDDVTADERFGITLVFAERAPVSAAAVVIPGPRDAFGVLVASARIPRSFESDEIEFMQAVANVIGVAVERAEEGERLEAARAAERSRIARELHDDALRELTEALGLATMARSITTEPQDVERWTELTLALRRVGRQLRSAIYDLRLGTDDAGAFADQLGDLVAIQAGRAVDRQIELRGQAALPAGTLGHRGNEVLRIVGEAITNARRHSGARIIRVEVGRSTVTRLRIEVSDDGAWPDRELVLSARRGEGIIGMFERAAILGATLKIEEGTEGGTVLSLELALGPGSEAHDRSR